MQRQRNQGLPSLANHTLKPINQYPQKTCNKNKENLDFTSFHQGYAG